MSAQVDPDNFISAVEVHGKKKKKKAQTDNTTRLLFISTMQKMIYIFSN